MSTARLEAVLKYMDTIGDSFEGGKRSLLYWWSGKRGVILGFGCTYMLVIGIVAGLMFNTTVVGGLTLGASLRNGYLTYFALHVYFCVHFYDSENPFESTQTVRFLSNKQGNCEAKQRTEGQAGDWFLQ